MFERGIERNKASLFPLFFATEEGEVGLSGSGFFLDDRGTFITAWHVLHHVPPGSMLLYGGVLPHRSSPVRTFDVIFEDQERDIAIGKIPNEHSVPVALQFQRVGIGRSVCFGGYPFARIQLTAHGEWITTNVRQYWQPTFTVDDYYDESLTPADHFIYGQEPGIPGMSGGPVFGLDGKVLGVNLGTLTRTTAASQLPELELTNSLFIDMLSLAPLLARINSDIVPDDPAVRFQFAQRK